MKKIIFSIIKWIFLIIEWSNEKGSYNIRYDLLDEEHILYKKEEDLVWIYFDTVTCLIPITKKGVDILNNSYNFINDLFDYEDEIKDFLKDSIYDGIIPKKSIEYFNNILDAYEKINLKWIEAENILIFNTIKDYNFKTKIEIASLAELEVLIRLLNQDIDLEDVKRLSGNHTPILFPIKNSCSTDFSRYISIKRNFYRDDVDLSNLLKNGHLKLNRGGK